MSDTTVTACSAAPWRPKISCCRFEFPVKLPCWYFPSDETAASPDSFMNPFIQSGSIRRLTDWTWKESNDKTEFKLKLMKLQLNTSVMYKYKYHTVRNCSIFIRQIKVEQFLCGPSFQEGLIRLSRARSAPAEDRATQTARQRSLRRRSIFHIRNLSSASWRSCSALKGPPVLKV